MCDPVCLGNSEIQFCATRMNSQVDKRGSLFGSQWPLVSVCTPTKDNIVFSDMVLCVLEDHLAQHSHSILIEM